MQPEHIAAITGATKEFPQTGDRATKRLWAQDVLNTISDNRTNISVAASQLGQLLLARKSDAEDDELHHITICAALEVVRLLTNDHQYANADQILVTVLDDFPDGEKHLATVVLQQVLALGRAYAKAGQKTEAELVIEKLAFATMNHPALASVFEQLMADDHHT